MTQIKRSREEIEKHFVEPGWSEDYRMALEWVLSDPEPTGEKCDHCRYLDPSALKCEKLGVQFMNGYHMAATAKWCEPAEIEELGLCPLGELAIRNKINELIRQNKWIINEMRRK